MVTYVDLLVNYCIMYFVWDGRLLAAFLKIQVLQVFTLCWLVKCYWCFKCFMIFWNCGNALPIGMAPHPIILISSHIFYPLLWVCCQFLLSAVLVWGWNFHWLCMLSITFAGRIASYVMCDTYFTLNLPVCATFNISCDHMYASLCCSGYVLQPDSHLHWSCWSCE